MENFPDFFEKLKHAQAPVDCGWVLVEQFVFWRQKPEVLETV